MFANGRKTIGLFVFNTHGDFQNDICRGMAVRTEELGYNLAIFASYGNYGAQTAYPQGEISILDLPAYEDFAGIVLCLDTFNIPGSVERVMENIKQKATCPVVSLRVPLENASNILIDDYGTMEGIIRHVIEEHGKKRVAFLTGPRDRADAQKRLSCFQKVMEEHGYPIEEHQIFYGDFWKNEGKHACDWFLAAEEPPEAIICANDYMALAVIDELFLRGISVPDDILVTGYDGIEEGAVYIPSLSSVHVDFIDMARRAVDLIDRHQEDNKTEKIYAVTRTIVRESCGCMEKGHILTKQQRCRQHREHASRENLEMQFSFMTINLGQVKEIRDMHQVIEKYVYNIAGFRDYFICLRDDIEDKTEDAFVGYTDKMHVRVAMRDRANMQEIDLAFDRSDLIPPEFTGEGPQCYYFFPLHSDERNFGYEALSFERRDQRAEAYVRWNIAISNAIDNILNQKRMNDLIYELQNMYIQDVMTGLYNRRGFEKYARMQFLQAKAGGSVVCVIGIDMDGLKPINDIYGHHEGDSALRSVGYAIQEASHPGQIGARIGGDEFEVIFPCEGEADVKEWIHVFETSLDNYNKKSGNPYEVHASWGYKVGIPMPEDTIESFMSESDDIMYRNKLENKRRRNEVLR